MTPAGIRGEMESGADAAASFDPLRPLLTRVAYRMLGSVADAEDVVQDAFIRWLGTDRDAVREPAAFLRRTVTRLCLDQLKSARAQRETYVGPWLPDPLVEEEEDDDVTLPLMLALERLSPLERAAFLLHDVFGVEFDEVAKTIDRDAAATRQLAARARSRWPRRPRWRAASTWVMRASVIMGATTSPAVPPRVTSPSTPAVVPLTCTRLYAALRCHSVPSTDTTALGNSKSGVMVCHCHGAAG